MKLEFFRNGNKDKENKINKTGRREMKLPEIERVENALESIDFELLKNCFKNMYKQFGLDPNNMNFLNKEDIDVRKYILTPFHFEAFMTNKLKKGKLKQEININSAIVFSDYREEDFNKYLLNIVVHEEVHITNSHVLKGCVKEKSDPYILSGIESGKNNDIVYSLFNEGLTEKIKDIILNEYGSLKVDKIKYDNDYLEGRFLVDVFIFLVSQDTKIDGKSILDALIRSAYENSSLDDNSDLYNEKIKLYLSKIRNNESNLLYKLINNIKKDFDNLKIGLLGKEFKSEFLKSLDINQDEFHDFVNKSGI